MTPITAQTVLPPRQIACITKDDRVFCEKETISMKQTGEMFLGIILWMTLCLVFAILSASSFEDWKKWMWGILSFIVFILPCVFMIIS